MQVFALLPEFCTHEVGLTTHCELKKVELTREWTTRSGLRCVSRLAGRVYGCPARSATTLEVLLEVLLEMFEKNFQNAVSHVVRCICCVVWQLGSD